MNLSNVGRPTEEEFDRLEELVDEYFVGDLWAIDCRCWDDGDVHLTAYSTLGTNCDDGYPIETIHHRQLIIYKRDDNEAWYVNRLKINHPRPDRELNRFEIEW